MNRNGALTRMKPSLLALQLTGLGRPSRLSAELFNDLVFEFFAPTLKSDSDVECVFVL
jgi:hypothetical protein